MIFNKWKSIEDVLSGHSDFKGRGGWFGFSDPTNKVYENLVIHDSQYEKPTKTWLESELKKTQDEWDALQYQRDRAAAYPEIAEQFDLLWHAIDDGKFNVKSKQTDFYKKLKAVKDAKPKPE